MKNWILSIKAMVLCAAIVLAPSCGNSGSGLPQINGVVGPMFNVVNGQIIMTFKLLNMQVDAGVGFRLPETQNSYLDFSPNIVDGGMLLEVKMDVEDLASVDVGIGDGNTLPDGRAIPGIPGGRLEDSLRFDTEFHDVSIYYHKKLFGVWIPVGFETSGITGFWNFKVKDKPAGTLTLVRDEPSRGHKAGALVLLRLDLLKDKQLKSLIQMSKRNPHLRY